MRSCRTQQRQRRGIETDAGPAETSEVFGRPAHCQECATVTVTLDVVARFPRSDTFTQYVPGFSVAANCAAEPAIAADVELVTVHDPPLLGPMPSPSALVVAGVTAVRVTPTAPAVVTVYVKVSEPPCDSEPLNVSSVGPFVLVFEESDGDRSNGLHAMLIADARASAIETRRGDLMELFSAAAVL